MLISLPILISPSSSTLLQITLALTACVCAWVVRRVGEEGGLSVEGDHEIRGGVRGCGGGKGEGREGSRDAGVGCRLISPYWSV